MNIVFRYDDFSAAKRLSYEIDEAVFTCFDAANIPLLVGVTPRMAEDVHDADEEETSHLEEDTRRVSLLASKLDRGWQLALHGLTHRRSRTDSHNEFARVRLGVQRERIRAGLSILKTCFSGRAVDVFIPPWNKYDRNTGKALVENGFRAVCGGSLSPYRDQSGLVGIPSYLDITDLLKYIRCFSIDDLIATVGDAYLVVTLHQYDFWTPKYGPRPFDRLTEVFSALRANDVRATTLTNFVPDFYKPLHPDLLAANLRLLSGNDVLSRCVAQMQCVLAQSPLTARLPRGTKALRAIMRAKGRYRNIRSGLSLIRRLASKATDFAQALLQSRCGRLRNECNVCGYTGPFGGFGAPGNPKRPKARCIRCGALERHRFLSFILERALKLRASMKRALVVAPDQAASVVKRHFHEVITSDFVRSNVHVRLDMELMPFPDRHFDLILANHVLDEVEDDAKAIQEGYRTLESGGWLIAPVPQLSGCTVEMEERRLDGKVRLAGTDYEERFYAAGFSLLRRYAAGEFPEAAEKHQFFVAQQRGDAKPEAVAIWEKEGQTLRNV